MTDTEPEDDETHTADMYHFRSRWNLVLFVVLILAIIVAALFWLLRSPALV